jgi:hypothetical protein
VSLFAKSWSVRATLGARPRRLRFDTGGYIYHVLNRAAGRAHIFKKSQDYAAFERVVNPAKAWLPMRRLASCSMPKYCRLVFWPFADGTVPRAPLADPSTFPATLRTVLGANRNQLVEGELPQFGAAHGVGP